MGKKESLSVINSIEQLYPGWLQPVLRYINKLEHQVENKMEKQEGFHLYRYVSELEEQVRVHRQGMKELEETIKELEESRQRLKELLDQKEATQ